MKNEFLAAINMLSNEKGVSPEVVVEALESALVSAYKRNFGDINGNIVATIDPSSGEPKVFAERLVVSEDPEPPAEVSLEAARAIKSDAQLGDVVLEDVTPRSFGRIAAQTAKQHIVQKLREAERRRVFEEFSERKGEIIHGLVERIEQRTVVLELGRTEAVMPPSEQVPSERYYSGQRLRVYVVEVSETPKGPQVLVSRAHKEMIKRLFEQEIPEIYNGIVEIKAIAREPGARSKVAVRAVQEGVDPVGSCVGMRGVRIQNIVNELGGEKIDVIPWDADAASFVAAALSPAQVQRVLISDDEKTATVIVPERQLSLAIGREGQNARLAARLTGWRIDIKSDVAVARAELEASGAGADGERLPGTTNGSGSERQPDASEAPAVATDVIEAVASAPAGDAGEAAESESIAREGTSLSPSGGETEESSAGPSGSDPA
jgi:N utilization substance protein A